MSDKTKLLDASSWKALPADQQSLFGVAKASAYGHTPLYGADAAEVKAMGGDPERTLSFTVSTPARDRDGDRIDQSGWDLSAFASNPVVPFAHDYKSLPVAKALKTWVSNSTDKDPCLKCLKEFPRKDQYEFGDTVFSMIKAGYLNACSVGFMPYEKEVDSAQPDDVDGARIGMKFLRQQLLESSIVPVPSNPHAIVDAKSFGIDVTPYREWCEKFLDEQNGEPGIWVPRKSVEIIHSLVSGTKKSVLVEQPKAAAQTTSYTVSNPDECLMCINAVADYLFSGPSITAEQAIRIESAIDVADGAIDLLTGESSSDEGETEDDEDSSDVTMDPSGASIDGKGITIDVSKFLADLNKVIGA